MRSFYDWLVHGDGYQITSGPIIALGIVAYFRRHNCHVRRCPFLAWHPGEDGHPVCRFHHPHHHGALSRIWKRRARHRRVDFLLAVVRSVGVATVVALLALASASVARADTGISMAGQFPAVAWSGNFTSLLGGAPMKWIRVPVSWSAGCGDYGAQQALYNNLWTIEHLHRSAVLVVGNSYWGAPAPTEDQYRCGVSGIEHAISSWGMGQWKMPIEAWNEPDLAGIPVALAVNFYADLVAAGWGDSWFRPVAGVFSNGYGVDQPSSYAWQYMAELKSTWAGAWAGSWSWHDYGDVVHSPNCSTYNVASACGRYEAGQMLSLLRGWKYPTSDTWITESGDPLLFQPNITRSQEAHEAYAWRWLKGAGEMHLLWYQFATISGDTWDSALQDATGVRDPSYCVIAYNEIPYRGLQRCGG